MELNIKQIRELDGEEMLSLLLSNPCECEDECEDDECEE